VIDRLRRSAGSLVVGIATAIVIVAISIVPFLTPQWVSFEQGRADAAAWTGFSPSQLRAATDSILSDLVLGPPRFDVQVVGRPVLTGAERAHMRDVRGVFTAFGILAIAALAVLAAARLALTGRASFWRGVRGGAAGLAVIVVAIGVVGAFAFDTAFEVFHRLFFAGGTYTFDPRTDRLVQLFPDQFWFETSMAAGATILVFTGCAWLAARRRIGVRRDSVATAPHARLEPSR
jgi:integral membrane protein (TIGR01906 family)